MAADEGFSLGFNILYTVFLILSLAYSLLKKRYLGARYYFIATASFLSSLDMGFTQTPVTRLLTCLNLTFWVTNLGFLNYLLILLLRFAKQALALRVPGLWRLIMVYLLTLLLAYSNALRWAGLRDTTTSKLTHSLQASAYFVVMTFTTVGYGDLVPASGAGRLLASLAALNGYVVLAVAISVLVARALRTDDAT